MKMWVAVYSGPDGHEMFAYHYGGKTADHALTKLYEALRPWPWRGPDGQEEACTLDNFINNLEAVCELQAGYGSTIEVFEVDDD